MNVICHSSPYQPQCIATICSLGTYPHLIIQFYPKVEISHILSPIRATLVHIHFRSLYHSLVDQTTPSAALDVLHHQHAEGGSGHSGTVFVTDVGM